MLSTTNFFPACKVSRPRLQKETHR